MGERVNVAAFKVTLDGQDLTDRLQPVLIELTLTEKRGGEADELELKLVDRDGATAIPPAGAVLHVWLGWGSGPDVQHGLVDKGGFKVDEAEWSGPPDMISIKARSANFASSFRSRRERTHRDTTLGAVLNTLAGDNGLTARVAPSLASIAVPVLAQDQRSDMAMIQELARRHDAVAQVRNGILLFQPIGSGQSASGRPLPPTTLTKVGAESYSYKRAERPQASAVEARYHDQRTGRRHTVREEVRHHDDGAAEASRQRRNGERPVRRLRRTHHSEASARRAARSTAQRTERRGAEFEFSLSLGRPDLYPERPVSVSGFKPEIDGKSWRISEVSHSLTGTGGLTSKLKLETA